MQQTEIRIKPPGSFSPGLQEIWAHRELLYFFVWRDIKVKYKQTLIGILWALLQPALLMLIFYFVFARTFNVSVGMNYFVFAFSGLILWGLFSSGISDSSDSLVSNAAMIRKIYFPKLLIPLAALVTAGVDFIFAFALLLLLLPVFHQPVHWSALYLFPLGILFTAVSSFSIGTLLSALNVKYRDFRYLLPFLLQVLFFGSQIIYSAASIRAGLLRKLFYLNPLNGALEIFKQPLHGAPADIEGISISIISMTVIFLAAILYFRRTEAYIADLI